MYKTIVKIIVFAWALTSAITWADETDATGGIVYRLEPGASFPGESFAGVPAVLRNYIDYSRYLSPAAEIDISRQLAKAEVAARFRDRTLF